MHLVLCFAEEMKTSVNECLQSSLRQHLFVGVADVQAMLLSDMLVFLQEKDQKYVFASLVSSTKHCFVILYLDVQHQYSHRDSVSCGTLYPQDQRSTVLSLLNLIVREVANEERGKACSSFLSVHCITCIP